MPAADASVNFSGVRVKLCAVLIALVLAFAAVSASARDTQSMSAIQSVLAFDVCIAPVEGNQTIRDLLEDRIQFNCESDARDPRYTDFWIASQTIAPGTLPYLGVVGTSVGVASGAVWQDSRTLYVRYSDGYLFSKIVTVKNSSQTVQLGAQFVDMIPVREADIERVFWKIEGASDIRAIITATRLMTAEQISNSNLFFSTLYSTVAGLLIALIVHHAMLWKVMGHKFQISYCAVLISTLFYVISSSAALTWFIPEIDNQTRIRANFVFLGAIMAFILLFSRNFFERNVYQGALLYTNRAVVTMVIVSSLGYALLIPRYTDYLSVIFLLSFAAGGLLLPYILYRAWIKNNQFVGLFALGWTFPAVAMFTRILSAFGILPWNIWIDNSTIIAMSLEALLLAAAIVFQIKVLEQERDEAQISELAARKLADTDPLTRLLNRRALLREVIGRVDPQKLYIVDIDYFREVNEQIGHDGGDNVLVGVANALRKILPDQGIAARLGGDEFAIVVPHDIPFDPQQLIHEVRSSISFDDVPVTVSVGSSVGSTQLEAHWRQLYSAADRALYRAKDDGRSRYNFASTPG